MDEPLNVLYTDEGFYRSNGKKAGKKANLYLTKEALIIYKGSLAKEFGRSFGAIGGLVGGAIAGAKEKDKNVLFAANLTDVKKISPKKSLLTGARIDFEMKNGEDFNFAGTSMSMGGLKKGFDEVAEIIKKANPQVELGA